MTLNNSLQLVQSAYQKKQLNITTSNVIKVGKKFKYGTYCILVLSNKITCTIYVVYATYSCTKIQNS